jgi:hypothetical protein
MLITRNLPSTVSEHITKLVQAKGSVNSNKTKLVLFTKKKKVDRFREPVLLNRVIHPTGLLKYLEILDAKLTWREHVKPEINIFYSSF